MTTSRHLTHAQHRFAPTNAARVWDAQRGTGFGAANAAA